MPDNRQQQQTMANNQNGPNVDHYSNELAAYAGYAQQINSGSVVGSSASQDYHHHHHSASHQQLPVSSVFKRDHHPDDISAAAAAAAAAGGYSYPRAVKLYEHTMEPYSPNQTTTAPSTAFRGDAPSPGASIIDLSTSSVVTSLRSQCFSSSAAYYDGQRYDRSPQSASSPHYSSPQMLSPQGQTLDLSVGRTTMG